MAIPLALAAGLVFGLARLLRRPAALLGLPPVVAEMLAGFTLGPTLLGTLAPAAFAAAFPAEVTRLVCTLGSVAVAAYCLVVGLELEPGHLAGRRAAMAITALASGLVPAAAGWAAAGLLGNRLPGASAAPRSAVALVLAVTAFPVLLRIVDDAGLNGRPAAVFSTGVAAMLELLVWASLPPVLAASSAGDGSKALSTVACVAGFVLLWFTVVRSALRRLWAGIPPRGPAGLVLLGLVGLGSALVTDRIGIHAIVGAFVGGVVVPREAAADLARRLKPVAVRLLPVFFAATGLRTRLALDAGTLAVTLGLAGLAYAAKFGATTLATRGTAGLGWSDAATVGHLTCAKGAIGFAVLEACRGAGLLDPRTYSVLAFVVAADTVMAAWAVRLQEGLPPRWRPPARAPCSAPP